jgi:hypothetical protein
MDKIATDETFKGLILLGVIIMCVFLGILVFSGPDSSKFLEGNDMARLQRILCIGDIWITSDEVLEPFNPNLSTYETEQREERMREGMKKCLDQFKVR